MTQTTLEGPDHDSKPLNTRDITAEDGWSPKRIVDAINAMFTEVYGLFSAAVAINTYTDDHILDLTDAGAIVEMNKGTANTLTVPPNADVAFPVDTRIDLVQFGAGTTTIAAGSGVTIRSLGDLLDMGGQYAGASLYKRGTNEWVLVGTLA